MEKCPHQPQCWVQQLDTAVTKAMCLLDSQPELVKQMASQHVDDGWESSPLADVRINTGVATIVPPLFSLSCLCSQIFYNTHYT